MSTEVAVPQQRGQLAHMGKGGASSYQADSGDLVLPRLYPAQKTSKVVEEGLAKLGQIITSTGNKVLGKPLLVLPIKQWKLWTVTDGKKIAAIEPYTGEDKPLQFQLDGRTYKRYFTMKFLALLPSEVDAFVAAKKELAETGILSDDAEGLLPYEITCKSTSLHAGKEILGHMMKMVQLGALPHQRGVLLDTEIREGDNGKYAVWTAAKGPVYQAADLPVLEATNWLNLLSGRAYKTDEADDDAVAAEAMAQRHDDSGPVEF